jgi:hypothetical protein
MVLVLCVCVAKGEVDAFVFFCTTDLVKVGTLTDLSVVNAG